MKLTVIGTGYVGLVSGACFAEMGNKVVCVDIDEKKIRSLESGNIPIYEPGLEGIVKSNVEQGRLLFTTSLSDPKAESSMYMIAVGTPPEDDGSADLQHVLAVAKQLGQTINKYSVIVDKSTVPVGTGDLVTETIQKELGQRKKSIEFDVVSNPEFLKEGAAVDDFMRPDRIVVGTNSEKARKIMHELYEPFMRTRDRVLFMGIREAEMTKYAANAMLATKISFMNEIANMCDIMNVDVEDVRRGIGSDSRIGYSFIYPGAGYGGSCFPKDVKAIIHMANSHQFEPVLMNAVEERNANQKEVLPQKVLRQFDGNVKGKVFTVWGLAFKPGTDDMREAPSINLINALIQAGATIQAYDPVVEETAKREFPQDYVKNGMLRIMDDQYGALANSDALILITEWKQFRRPDFLYIKDKLKQAIIFDGRNQYDPAKLRELGFKYIGIGR